MALIIPARTIREGFAEGQVLRSAAPIGFFGHVDPRTGMVLEPGHPLQGRTISGRILAFPRAKGSTVGSYILYALRKNQRAPAAMLLEECETIVAVGAIIAEIPTFDRVDLARLRDGDRVRIEGARVILL
jgi:hypothetical protein